MAIEPILAMTGAEIQQNAPLPPKLGWLGCHFSPCGTGLSNLPRQLRAGSMLILDDAVPIHGHDPARILAELEAAMARLQCESLLLDFQRPGEPETEEVAAVLVRELSCPVGVSALYGEGLECPLFLPPAPLDVPLADHLAPWKGREVWLEAALDGQILTLTESGCASAPLPPGEKPQGGHWEARLHCHYTIQAAEDRAVFTLYRTPEDLQALLEEAQTLGVTRSIGLYQELDGLLIP